MSDSIEVKPTHNDNLDAPDGFDLGAIVYVRQNAPHHEKAMQQFRVVPFNSMGEFTLYRTDSRTEEYRQIIADGGHAAYRAFIFHVRHKNDSAVWTKEKLIAATATNNYVIW